VTDSSSIYINTEDLGFSLCALVGGNTFKSDRKRWIARGGGRWRGWGESVDLAFQLEMDLGPENV